MAISFLSRRYRGGGIPGAHLRRATHDDYTGVVSMDKHLYEGMDYLPMKFHKYIENPRRRLYVCMKDNEIVAFQMFLMVDDGRTIVGQAGRVRPNFRGIGLIPYILEEAIKDILKEYPIRHMVWTTQNAKETQAMQRWSKEVQVAKMVRANMDFTSVGLEKLLYCKQFHNICKEYGADEVQCLSQENARRLLCSIEKPKNLIPYDYWCVHSEPFSPLPCNYDIPLVEFRSEVLTTFNAGECAQDVSFGTFKEGVRKDRYYVDLYLDKQLDKDVKSLLMTRHLLKQLCLLDKRTSTKNIRLIMVMHDHDVLRVDYNMVRDIMLEKIQMTEMDKEFNFFEDEFFICATKLKLANAQL